MVRPATWMRSVPNLGFGGKELRESRARWQECAERLTVAHLQLEVLGGVSRTRLARNDEAEKDWVPECGTVQRYLDYPSLRRVADQGVALEVLSSGTDVTVFRPGSNCDLSNVDRWLSRREHGQILPPSPRRHKRDPQYRQYQERTQPEPAPERAVRAGRSEIFPTPRRYDQTPQKPIGIPISRIAGMDRGRLEMARRRPQDGRRPKRRGHGLAVQVLTNTGSQILQRAMREHVHPPRTLAAVPFAWRCPLRISLVARFSSRTSR